MDQRKDVQVLTGRFDNIMRVPMNLQSNPIRLLYYLNKKLTAALEKRSLDELYRSSFYVRLNRMSKASRLGLVPLPRELREIILSKVFMPSN